MTNRTVRSLVKYLPSTESSGNLDLARFPKPHLWNLDHTATGLEIIATATKKLSEASKVLGEQCKAQVQSSYVLWIFKWNLLDKRNNSSALYPSSSQFDTPDFGSKDSALGFCQVSQPFGNWKSNDFPLAIELPHWSIFDTLIIFPLCFTYISVQEKAIVYHVFNYHSHTRFTISPGLSCFRRFLLCEPYDIRKVKGKWRETTEEETVLK